ncbi:maleylpyruvate isomerase family mycothiol-dependent enzyme [Streptomyces himalayensis]|uniref:Maleylpyruvate isomerase family mycothiol-dependent enzyme n=1 Tax=Streptomyces himalayensis subsp. himalayensis TaxID=2756131 RepID=A0A7W0IC25_9ACTN|nr:maleylpyruvate isomerase family mycothiol-dependent enzyme [Streptomyces himalayensis]MBA2950058.1 maleylpyruvate isomerase family mycothiol-dependent enzyme [Streptomyces himalayensis subsp. himalayensis]
MPPAKKRTRTRSYDSAKIRAAVLTQFGSVREAVRALTDQQLAAPAQLGDWTIRELAAHIAMTVESVSRNVERDAPAKADLDLVDLLSASASRADDIAVGARKLARDTPDLDALYSRTEQRIAGHLAATPDTRLLATPVGAISLGDYLVTRTVELVVHTDDLNRAAGLDIPYDRQALAACTRMLADALALRAPGASTEVRVPPFAVVQCIEGPRHTRGTPPNVVETDPLTWIRLATGRTTWEAELAAAHVSASGERADLSALLPLMG